MLAWWQEEACLAGTKGSHWGILENKANHWDTGLPSIGCGTQVCCSLAVDFSFILCITRGGGESLLQPMTDNILKEQSSNSE